MTYKNGCQIIKHSKNTQLMKKTHICPGCFICIIRMVCFMLKKYKETINLQLFCNNYWNHSVLYLMLMWMVVAQKKILCKKENGNDFFVYVYMKQNS